MHTGWKRRTVGLVAGLVLSGCGLIAGNDDSQSAPTSEVEVGGTVVVDVGRPLGEISPLIRGVSGDPRDFVDANVAFNSWGGPRATRFNYQLGNAWNTGRDGAFRNESVASAGDLVGEWLEANAAAGIESRVAVPALGWIARDGDSTTCSFPDESGDGCLTATGFDCSSSGPIADPLRANVGSSPATAAEWIGGYEDQRIDPEFLAVDNEPERWGIDHYDVHPTCTDYFEIFGTYVAYATALRDVVPSAQLSGPVMCCWYEFADPPGPGDGTDEDLLTWFLRMINERAAEAPADAAPILDVVDLHFRPQADVVNSRSNGEIDALRVDAPRELWDPEHEGGAFGDVIEFLPRMRRTTDRYFPGMPIMISDWRFGGEESIPGAVAIFETLGIYAREGVYAAAHADTLTPGTPGFHAFRLFGNYDGRGSAFEGVALDTEVDGDADVGAFAAVERRTLRIGLVNRSPDETTQIQLDIAGVDVGTGSTFTYARDDVDEFAETRVRRSPDGLFVELPPMSASMVELRLRGAVDIEAPADPTSVTTNSTATTPSTEAGDPTDEGESVPTSSSTATTESGST